MDVRENRSLLGPGRREAATVARSAVRERSDSRQTVPAPVQAVGRESRGASDVDTVDPWPVQLVSRSSSSLYSDRGSSNIEDQSLHELAPGVCGIIII